MISAPPFRLFCFAKTAENNLIIISTALLYSNYSVLLKLSCKSLDPIPTIQYFCGLYYTWWGVLSYTSIYTYYTTYTLLPELLSAKQHHLFFTYHNLINLRANLFFFSLSVAAPRPCHTHTHNEVRTVESFL